MVSLERLIELSLPMDLALENPLELLVLLPRPFLTSLRGAGAPERNLSSIDLCPGGAGILDNPGLFLWIGLGMAEAPLAGLAGTEGILGVEDLSCKIIFCCCLNRLSWKNSPKMAFKCPSLMSKAWISCTATPFLAKNRGD